jgi:hypothetical protein
MRATALPVQKGRGGCVYNAHSRTSPSGTWDRREVTRGSQPSKCANISDFKPREVQELETDREGAGWRSTYEKQVSMKEKL